MARGKEVGIRLSVKDGEVVERALKNLGREGQEALERIRRSARPASDGLKTINGGALAARSAMVQLNGTMQLVTRSLGFVGGGFLGGALVSQVRDAARGIAEVGDAARRAGLDLKSFQELKFVAEQNRLGVDALTDGIKELNLRADEFITTKGGPAAEAFQRLGFTADELATKLKNPSELFTEIIGKLSQLDRAAAIRIADEIFGGSAGERFVQLIEQGEDGIRRTVQEAHNLGLVMSDELVAKAEDLDRKFNAAAATVGTALKSAIVEAADALTRFLEEFDKLEDRSTDKLVEELNFLRTEKLREKGDPFGIIAAQNRVRGVDARIAEIEAEIFKRGERRSMDLLNPPSGSTLPPGGLPVPSREAENERKKIEGVIQALRDEIAMVGMAEEEKRVLNELRRAGVEAASAEGQTIRGLVHELMAEEKAWKQVEDVIGNVGGTARDVLGGILNDIRAGKTETEIWANSLNRLLDKMLTTGLELGVGAAQTWLTSLFRPQASTGGAWGGGLWGSAIPFGQAHGGWEVGRGAPPQSRMLSPSMLAGLPRRHMGGLNADEQMVVARRGEGIFTPRQMDNTATLINALVRNLERGTRGDGGGSANLRVEIVNPDGDKTVEHASARREADGSVIAQVVLGTVKRGFADGSMDGVMNSLYGVRRIGR